MDIIYVAFRKIPHIRVISTVLVCSGQRVSQTQDFLFLKPRKSQANQGKLVRLL